MPEGPSIVILKEEVQPFVGKKVIQASGNVKTFEPEILIGKKVVDFRSWGKHFLILFPHITLRAHFLMFRTYRINEKKDAAPRLSLQFAGGGELNFYSTAIRPLEGSPDDIYDWSTDVMSDQWDSRKALKKLRATPDAEAGDVLLDQTIFSGVGNIIRNEVLYRIKVHPESRIGALPAKKLRELVAEAVNYSFDFLRWKKEFTLRKHWLAHKQKTCSQCSGPILKEYPGKAKRRSFFCGACQVLYA